MALTLLLHAKSTRILPSSNHPYSYLFELSRSITETHKRCSSSLLRFQVDNYEFDPDSTYSFLIDSSTSTRDLSQVHAHLLVLGFQDSGFLITKLVNSCSNIGEVGYARKLFDEFLQPTVFLWNAIIRAYSKRNMFGETLEMYSRMQASRVSPDFFTLPYVLKACCGLPSFPVGRLVHAQVFRHGFVSDPFLQNGLVALYAKCGQIERARAVFDRLWDRTVVSWTSMVSGYAQNGRPLEALKIYGQMKEMNVMPDWISLVSVLKAYTDVEELEKGKSVHGLVIKVGLQSEQDLLIALASLYSKCGLAPVARSLFDQLEIPNLILWNAMISGYAKNGFAMEAVSLFKEMVSKNIHTDSITLRSTIAACAQVGSLELAMWAASYLENTEFRNNVFVSTALIDMYAKCGSVELARRVFEHTIDKDIVVWSAMIVGYGLHGLAREAIDLFQSMKHVGVCPNDVTFIGLLTACNHAGRVEDGWHYFHAMRGYGVEPRHQHYACVVDLLARAGLLDKAYDFITKMEIEPRVSIWAALLSACKIYRHVPLGEYAARQLFSLDPLNTGHYVQLSNLYAAARMWDHVSRIRVLMREKGMIKDLGWSLIVIDRQQQAFRVGDKTHPRSKEIYEDLRVWRGG